MKQLIIVRKDLNMSAGNLAVQVATASMAFLTAKVMKSIKREIDKGYSVLPAYEDYEKKKPQLYKRSDLAEMAEKARNAGKDCFYIQEVPTETRYPALVEVDSVPFHYATSFDVDVETYDWIKETQTKVIYEANSINQLMAVKEKAKELGLIEGEDFFLISDMCQADEEKNAITSIGFRPLPVDIVDKISTGYQLYK